MSDAAAMVQDETTLALGGMTLYRRPVAFVHHLLQHPSPPKNLTLLNFTAGYESDLLVGAGIIKHVRSCYFGLEAFGLAPMFTAAANAGKINIIEETESSIVMGIRATMSGVGFMPSTAWLGTDLLQLRPDVRTVKDPYSDETLIAFPAITCDVAVIHALQADERGNAVLNTNYAIDRELALIADTVIITAEEIVENIGNTIDIPATLVSAVVYAPRGAWPTSCHPHYPIDGDEILAYIEACAANDFATYYARLKRNVSE